MLLNERSESFTVHGFYKVIRSTQTKRRSFVIDDGHHDHRNVRQFRIGFDFVQNRPSIAIGKKNVQSDEQRAHLSG